MEDTPNPKCTRCKCYWKPDDTDIKSSGLVCKSCKKCRENNNKFREENKEYHKQYRQENKEYHKQYYQENKEKILEKTKQYQQENKEVIAEKKKQYQQENKEVIAEKKKQYRQENKEVIAEKKKQYRQENKEKLAEIDKQYYQENKEKIAEQMKQYRQENKEKAAEYMKQYRQENKEKIEEYRKQYRQENKEKMAEIHKQYYQYIKQNNMPLYLVHIQRKQINKCFRKSTLEKNKHSIEYLGCSPEELITFFDKKIEYYNTYMATDTIMTRDNIHIDHIKPISKFNLDDEEEFLDCCHYTNLQPLLVKDNLEKSNKWSDENNQYWLENIKGKDTYLEIYIP